PADVGAKAAKAEQDIAALQGRIEELTHTMETQSRQTVDQGNRLETRLAALEQTQTKLVDKVAPSMPDDKEQLWQQAAARLASGQRDDGRRFYRVFIQRFPQDPRAAQAYLAIGMSFVQESKHPNAAAEFQKVLTVYPSAPEVPEAMWQLSLAFVQLHFCTGATMLVLPSDVVAALGVPFQGMRRVRYASGAFGERAWVGNLEIEILGRKTICTAIVEKAGTTPLIGQIPLEELDLLVDPKSR